ncbi:MAG TPA: DUF559 domain-containing protein [Solirubrobacteraceae bacterium]|nr:DUF559 domain-containing protein [Solirubrobacteraceae bacterium]
MRWDQILGLGIAEPTIRRWVADGYLEHVLPRVYAVGHAAPSHEADLAAALLYAGPRASLSHASGLWGWQLLDHPVHPIQVSTPRRVRSRPGIEVHTRRGLDRVELRGLTVCTVDQALLDFAAVASPARLRFVLANADYLGLLHLEALDALMGRGVRGSAALRAALATHRPELAHTRSELERLLITLVARHGFPAPRCNVHVHGHLVDALFADAKVIIEVDGYRGHRSPAQLRSDHQRDLELRAQGYVVLRYTWDQLTTQTAAVVADLARHLLRGDGRPRRAGEAPQHVGGARQ